MLMFFSLNSSAQFSYCSSATFSYQSFFQTIEIIGSAKDSPNGEDVDCRQTCRYEYFNIIITDHGDGRRTGTYEYADVYTTYICHHRPFPSCGLNENFNEECFDDTGQKWSSRWDYELSVCESYYIDVNDYKISPKSKIYCRDRYWSIDESEEYDDAAEEYKESSLENFFEDSEEIDISEEIGISSAGSDSLSSVFPDLLTDMGIHGNCMPDIDIEIFGKPILLEVSIICSWLYALGNIFVLVSLVFAYKIIAGVPKASRFHVKR